MRQMICVASWRSESVIYMDIGTFANREGGEDEARGTALPRADDFHNSYIDCHIHIEKGDYSPEWVDCFVDAAAKRGIGEIWLLEHCYLFPKFVPMYEKLRSASAYLDKWFARKAGKRDFGEFLRLAERVRGRGYPITIKFGLEVCYFKEYEEIWDIWTN